MLLYSRLRRRSENLPSSIIQIATLKELKCSAKFKSKHKFAKFEDSWSER